MVGAKGFEPSTSWSRTRRASQAALRPDTYGGNNPTSLSYRMHMRNLLGRRFFLALLPSVGGAPGSAARWCASHRRQECRRHWRKL
jgi:hypothetical protein